MDPETPPMPERADWFESRVQSVVRALLGLGPAAVWFGMIAAGNGDAFPPEAYPFVGIGAGYYFGVANPFKR